MIFAATEPRREPPGARSDLEAPPGARRPVTFEEAFPELAIKVPERRALISAPFALYAVRVPLQEPMAATGPMGRRCDRRTRPGRVSAPWTSGEITGHRTVYDGLPPALPVLIKPRGPAAARTLAMPYYECPKCGGGYVIDVPPSARPTCDRDGARLKRASDASYSRYAREK